MLNNDEYVTRKEFRIYIVLFIILNLILIFGLIELKSKIKEMNQAEHKPWQKEILWTI